MRVSNHYSHLNGLESLRVKKEGIWEEILSVIEAVDANEYRTKISNEKTNKNGKALYSPGELNTALKAVFNNFGWNEGRFQYYVTTDATLAPTLITMPPEKQKEELQRRGLPVPRPSYKQTDFVKDGVSVEVQFGKYSFVAYDLFVKHQFFYSARMIDVGVEILPSKSMSMEMSSGVSNYETEIHNIIVQGRTVPSVPLVIVGIAP